MKRRIGLALALALVGGAAQAHSPYLLPNSFDASSRDHVTVEGSFTEHFFTADIAMKSDDFHAIGPDGARVPLTPIYTRDLVILEVPVSGAGTWRITSGARVGRTAKAALVGGVWKFFDPDKPPPAGVTLVDMQSITTAEVYVSRGAPNDAALAPSGKGLEFHALTHPDSIAVGEVAKFELLLDGKPLANQSIELHRSNEDYAEGLGLAPAVSDAEGRFSIKVDQPGAYLAMTRYRQSPAGDTAGHSLTYCLTFEAVR
jgi:uncharacterized GH25 family protein